MIWTVPRIHRLAPPSIRYAELSSQLHISLPLASPVRAGALSPGWKIGVRSCTWCGRLVRGTPIISSVYPVRGAAPGVEDRCAGTRFAPSWARRRAAPGVEDRYAELPTCIVRVPSLYIFAPILIQFRSLLGAQERCTRCGSTWRARGWAGWTAATPRTWSGAAGYTIVR